MVFPLISVTADLRPSIKKKQPPCSKIEGSLLVSAWKGVPVGLDFGRAPGDIGGLGCLWLDGHSNLQEVFRALSCGRNGRVMNASL